MAIVSLSILSHSPASQRHGAPNIQTAGSFTIYAKQAIQAAEASTTARKIGPLATRRHALGDNPSVEPSISHG
jgi:hypothetical protein